MTPEKTKQVVPVIISTLSRPPSNVLISNLCDVFGCFMQSVDRFKSGAAVNTHNAIKEAVSQYPNAHVLLL